MSICNTEIENRWKENVALLESFLIMLDKRGIVDSQMVLNHLNHHKGYERVWTAKKGVRQYG